MRIVWTITADLDLVPSPDALASAREEIAAWLDRVEDEIAGVLLDAGAGFQLETRERME